MPRPLLMGGIVVSDVATAVRLYAPKRVDRAVWTRIAPLVRDVVSRAEPATPWTAYAWLTGTAQFVAWAVEDDLLPLDVEALFTPDVVERHVLVGMRGRSDSSRSNRRAALSTIGRRVTRRAPWPPPRQRFAPATLAGPYTRADIEGYLAAARQQKTEHRTRVVHALLAGGLGAGLWPGEHLVITGRCVTERHGVLVVDVPGEHARQVPVLGAWADAVDALARRWPDEPLIGRVTAVNKNRLNQLVRSIEVPPRLPALHPRRLRATWLVTVLAAQVPLPTVMWAAGLTSMNSIEELLSFLPVQTEAGAYASVADALP